MRFLKVVTIRCRRGAGVYRRVRSHELGVHDLARKERIRTTNLGSGERGGFRLHRSPANASTHWAWREGRVITLNSRSAGVSGLWRFFHYRRLLASPPKIAVA